MTCNACKNRLLSHRLAGPFSDTCDRTYRGKSCANAHLSHSATNGFSYTKIFQAGTHFQVAIAEAEPEIEPHRVADDLDREAVMLIVVVGW
jgi:hypothetical protein